MSALTKISPFITSIKKSNQLTTFVETGCYKGESLNVASQLQFNQLYSCDINKDCVDNCLSFLPHANIQHTDSITFLKQTLPTINEKCLFWLDAHFPAHYGLEENEKTKFPLVEELLLIKELKHNYERDVILCDDIGILHPEDNPCYLPDDWPEFQVDLKVADLMRVLEDTHNAVILRKTIQGILVFSPK